MLSRVPDSRACAVLAVLLLVPALALAAPQDDEFRWEGSLRAGQLVEVLNVNGPVDAELADGDRVEVLAVKDGPRSDRGEIRVEVVEHDGGITVCALYDDRSSDCAPGDDADLGSSWSNDASVHFTVRVPAGVDFTTRTMNGALDIRDLDGDVRGHTMNGRIRVSTTGWAELKTMNGAIDARMGRTDWEGDLQLETMNGAVTVELPGDASVDVDCKTMNGGIDSDWDLDHGGWIRNTADGRIGAGGRGLTVRTMNGAIRIRQAS